MSVSYASPKHANAQLKIPGPGITMQYSTSYPWQTTVLEFRPSMADFAACEHQTAISSPLLERAPKWISKEETVGTLSSCQST